MKRVSEKMKRKERRQKRRVGEIGVTEKRKEEVKRRGVYEMR